MISDATGWQLEATPWVDGAACLGADPGLWFPEAGQNVQPLTRSTCAACPVNPECLDYALAWNITHGIWGGLSPNERRSLVPTRHAIRIPAAHGTLACYEAGCHCDECRGANRAAEYWRQHRKQVS